MDERLKEAFNKIYEGEAKAALRLKIFAKKAEQEDLPQIAKLFRVISFSEEIHGGRALRMLREIKDTETNLKDSFASETHIAGVAYDHFSELAGEIGDITASNIFSNSKDVEDGHAKLYKKAMGHLIEERETTYYVCKVCGYVSDGVWPETCPVCSAPKDQCFACKLSPVLFVKASSCTKSFTYSVRRCIFQPVFHNWRNVVAA